MKRLLVILVFALTLGGIFVIQSVREASHHDDRIGEAPIKEDATSKPNVDARTELLGTSASKATVTIGSRSGVPTAVSQPRSAERPETSVDHHPTDREADRSGVGETVNYGEHGFDGEARRRIGELADAVGLTPLQVRELEQLVQLQKEKMIDLVGVDLLDRAMVDESKLGLETILSPEQLEKFQGRLEQRARESSQLLAETYVAGSLAESKSAMNSSRSSGRL